MTSELRPFRTVGIIGLGLIGGSIARDLRVQWPATQILGVDRSSIAARALSSGAVHKVFDTVRDLADADLVVIATPIPVILETIGALSRSGFRGVLTDVGSTKRQVMAAAAASGLTRFVGGHPMAGSEQSGFDQSRTGVFAGRPWFVVPAETTSRDDLDAVGSLARAVGAEPVEIDATTHDRTVAYVSHLPQLVAVALMNAAAEGCGDTGLQRAGRAFAEMTRVAGSPAELWSGILDSNGDLVSEAVTQFVDQLQIVASGDSQPRSEAFDRAASHGRAHRRTAREPRGSNP